MRAVGGLATTGSLPEVMSLQVVIQNQKDLPQVAGSELIPKRRPRRLTPAAGAGTATRLESTEHRRAA